MSGVTSDIPTGRCGRAKAIVLLSGGLDSTLAVSMMLDQDVEVVALNFTGPFCTCSSGKERGCRLAAEAASSLGVEVRVLSKGMDYLRMIEKPRFGRGRGLNACIDCRIYMLRHAARVMDEVGASFVVTGEVLGQRPMSQHRAALDLIEQESGLSGRLLRPLCAHLLEETVPEREGLVRRERLLGIRGRSRGVQLALARNAGLGVYGCPSGGCRLTDAVVTRRMTDVFERCPDWGLRDAVMTTFGRHFRLSRELKVVLGRNEEENRRLEAMAGGLTTAVFADAKGPTAVLRGRMTPEDLAPMGRLMRCFAKNSTAAVLLIRLSGPGLETTYPAPVPAGAEGIAELEI